ncbi:hypothetical protein JXA85_07250 [Candidatus Woesearchaeota archaeon]|nr:hypothetical protein [Candidatus Woesearchaeota archaeon]
MNLELKLKFMQEAYFKDWGNSECDIVAYAGLISKKKSKKQTLNIDSF